MARLVEDSLAGDDPAVRDRVGGGQPQQPRFDDQPHDHGCEDDDQNPDAPRFDLFRKPHQGDGQQRAGQEQDQDRPYERLEVGAQVQDHLFVGGQHVLLKRHGNKSLTFAGQAGRG